MSASTPHVVDIWQEYDCPIQRTDLDLSGTEIKIVGETFYCCLCGHDHTTEEAGIDGTHILLSNGEMQYRGVPASLEKKAAWLAEIKEQTT